ncbi:hypothetical protein RHS02_09055, partial [Rhizoctonia solani]
MDARTEPELGAPLHWASVDFDAISFCSDTFGSPTTNSDFTSINRTANSNVRSACSRSADLLQCSHQDEANNGDSA